MNNQEALEKLADIEEFLYYKMQNPEELAQHWRILAQMHDEAKTLLCQWHNLTGCKLN